VWSSLCSVYRQCFDNDEAIFGGEQGWMSQRGLWIAHASRCLFIFHLSKTRRHGRMVLDNGRKVEMSLNIKSEQAHRLAGSWLS